MRGVSALFGPIGIAGFLVLVPVGQMTQLILLLVGANLVLISIVARDVVARRRAAIVSIEQDQRQLYLLRRTVPHLRARRPMGVVEAQVRWRQASEAHRRRNQPIARAANDQNPRIGPWPR
jgi:hypothetical protein